MDALVLHHFSEDGSITRFAPHTPRTNPTHPPAVWAIDSVHAPLYWFPRDCPRVTAWPRDDVERVAFRRAFATTAHRVHAIEAAWFERMQSTKLFCYDFDPGDFEPWEDASGQWISTTVVTPIRTRPVGDLVGAHIAAGIELRVVPSLSPVVELARDERWDFSIVRLMNATG